MRGRFSACWTFDSHSHIPGGALLELIRGLLLASHLLLVGVAMAAPLVCIWLEWRFSRYDDAQAGALGRALARSSQWSLLGGILLGLLLLGLRWQFDDPSYLSAFGRLPRRRLWFALAELIFFFGCMGAYSALWVPLGKWRFVHRLLAVAASSNLMFHFPAFFVIVSLLTTRAELTTVTLDNADYQRLLLDGEVLSRVAHVWLASFATTGIWLLWLGIRHGAPNDAARQHLFKRAAAISLLPTLLQIPVGLWVLLQMPEDARQPLFGGDPWATLCLLASILLAFQLMHTLAAIMLGDHAPKQIRWSMAILTAVILLMVGARSRTHDRAAAMHDADGPAQFAFRVGRPSEPTEPMVGPLNGATTELTP
jgi:hypothetical protein